MRRKLRLETESYDFIILILVMALTIFGVAMVFSASYYNALNDPDEGPYYYLIRQGGWAIVGFAFMMVMSMIDYHIWGKKTIAITIVVASFILLGLLFTPLGITINGATRWIKVGITIMPGEIAKIAAIIGTAAYLANNPNKILSFTQGILPLGLLAAAYGVLIYLQPNLSTAMVVVGIIAGIAFLAGLKLRYVAGAIGLAGLGVAFLVNFMPDSYHTARITSFLDPFADALDSGFQAVQSLLAISSGGVFGVGLGKSVQKSLYLPEPQNDFILAIIGEELGFIGILILMGVYAFLLYRGFRAAINAKDTLGMLLAGGITGMLGIQVLINVGVVTSCLPCTGITLPFISYGGNAMLLFMGSMGILLNISSQPKKTQEKVRK